MRSRKIEQGIFLTISLYAAGAVVWFIIIEYRGWRETGITLPSSTYVRFLMTLGLSILFGAGFFASRRKEREERGKSMVGKADGEPGAG